MKMEICQTVPPRTNPGDGKADRLGTIEGRRKVFATGVILVVALAFLTQVANAAAPESSEDSAAESAENLEGGRVASGADRLKNWPHLLGPAAGVSPATGLLMNWNGETGEGIKWKTRIPLPGYSSPIYWEGRLYLTGANASTRVVYCIDSQSGEIIWERPVKNIPGSPGRVEVGEDTGYAASTMATDGVRVFASFANGDLAAFDLEGSPVWSKNLGEPENLYGHASSLVTHGDKLLIQYDQENLGYVAVLEVATGDELWKTERDFGSSWSMPMVATIGTREEVFVAAEPTVVSYDLESGKELWRVDCLRYGEVTSVPVYADGLVYVSADSANLSAIDVKTQKIVWESRFYKPGVSTPLLHEGLLYCGADDGAFACYDAKTGEEFWAEFADDGFYASPILADGRVHLLDRSGTMHILKPGRELKILGQSVLGEETSCTPAVIGNSFYIRGVTHLFRIGP
jgi:outer membrane protein assembly factor BamB